MHRLNSAAIVKSSCVNLTITIPFKMLIIKLISLWVLFKGASNLRAKNKLIQ